MYPERDEQRTEPAGRSAAPPDEPDENRHRDQIGRVTAAPYGRARWSLVAPSSSDETATGARKEGGGSSIARREPRTHRAHARPFDLRGSGRGEGLRTRDHGLSLATGRDSANRRDVVLVSIWLTGAAPLAGGVDFDDGRRAPDRARRRLVPDARGDRPGAGRSGRNRRRGRLRRRRLPAGRRRPRRAGRRRHRPANAAGRGRGRASASRTGSARRTRRSASSSSASSPSRTTEQR